MITVFFPKLEELDLPYMNHVLEASSANIFFHVWTIKMATYIERFKAFRLYFRGGYLRNWTRQINRLRCNSSQHLHKIIFRQCNIWVVLSIHIKISNTFLNYMWVLKQIWKLWTYWLQRSWCNQSMNLLLFKQTIHIHLKFSYILNVWK